MAHNIEYRSYDENIHRDFVKRELDHYVSQVDWEEGCSGLYNGIRWLDNVPVRSDYEAAEQYLMDNDRGDYDNLAVRYYEYKRKNTKQAMALAEKSKAAAAEYRKRDDAVWAETLTSAFVSCKACGSRLSRLHLRGNFCPVCRADLRPETTIKAIERAKEKLEKAQKAEKEYAKQHSDKRVRWLVKFEYHT